MTFKKYVAQLNKLLKEHPETGSMLAVHARDDEGNGFGQVNYGPGAGHFEDGEFSSDGEHNAVCVN